MNLAAALAVSLAGSVGVVEFGSETVMAQAMKCETGPITKTYGSVPWLVYSCSDAKTVVIVSAPGSPAMPFYFTLSPRGDSYQLEGEGTGNKMITDAAAKELQQLSSSDISSLIEETRTKR